ncbi:MAG: polyprenyl synthetase family protein [Xanthobacteraceae bacterium]
MTARHVDIAHNYFTMVEDGLADLFVSRSRSNGASRLQQVVRFAVLSGGRRIRPILTLLSCTALGGKTADALPLALAIELVHAASLVLDDLPSMDDENERRSRITVHRKEGEAAAILVAISLLTRAFELTGAFDERCGGRTTVRLAKAVGAAGMCAGQFTDLNAQLLDDEAAISTDQVEQLCVSKTGLLMATACEFGAIAAKASPAQQKALFECGLNIGFAYQIEDDLQDTDCDAKLRRPNYAALVGRERAERRVTELVGEAPRSALRLGIDTSLLESYARTLMSPHISQAQPAL